MDAETHMESVDSPIDVTETTPGVSSSSEQDTVPSAESKPAEITEQTTAKPIKEESPKEQETEKKTPSDEKKTPSDEKKKILEEKKKATVKESKKKPFEQTKAKTKSAPDSPKSKKKPEEKKKETPKSAELSAKNTNKTGEESKNSTDSKNLSKNRKEDVKKKGPKKQYLEVPPPTSPPKTSTEPVKPEPKVLDANKSTFLGCCHGLTELTETDSSEDVLASVASPRSSNAKFGKKAWILEFQEHQKEPQR